MDIPSNISQDITCSRCDVFLRCSPVFIKPDGKALCTNCVDPKDQAIRNTQYEALAQLMKFPCKYKEFGCTKTFSFTNENQAGRHELICGFKQYLCPVSESGKCEWLGKRSQLLEHCQEMHPEQVVGNPCKLTHDITKSSLKNYLLDAKCKLLFLVHTKVCMESGKIYHSVRYIGNPELASKYDYVLKIKRNNLEMVKPGNVAPEGCFAIQENTSIALNTNNLLEFFEGFDNTTFTIIVRRHCKHAECKYVDIPIKCNKHERYFCMASKKCDLCGKSVEKNLVLHYQNSPDHKKDIIDVLSTPWIYSIAKNTNHKSVKFISTNASKVICIATNSKENDELTFEISIFSPVNSDKLEDITCIVLIQHLHPSVPFPVTKLDYNLKERYDIEADWSMKLKFKQDAFIDVNCVLAVIMMTSDQFI